MYKVYKIDVKENEKVLIKLNRPNSRRRIKYALVSENLYSRANEILYKRGLYFLDYLNFLREHENKEFVLLTEDEKLQELISDLLEKGTPYVRCSHFVFSGMSWIPSIEKFALEFPELNDKLLDRIKPESDFSLDIEDGSYDYSYDSSERPLTKLEYYGYEPNYERDIDLAERLYGVPDPRLVEDD